MTLDSNQPAGATTAPASRFRPFRKGGSHTASSAALLLMASSVGSGLLALVRIKFISHVFGAGVATDAYNSAFQLPDMINYFLVGGVASTSLVTMLNRYRAAGDDESADHALSVVLNAMLLVLGTGILLAEVLAPQYVWLFFKGYRSDPARAALCTHLTRLLLPAQLFFFAGGVLGSRNLVRKIFIYQALSPLIYNGGIILGGLLLWRRLGVDSLAWGVLAGTILGPLFANAFGSFRGGLRYVPVLSLRHPAFREWLRLSLPLILGVGFVKGDEWILKYYASVATGGITLLQNAKSLFNAPLNVIGPAAGAASLPFFAALYSQGKLADLSVAVNRAVSRLVAVSLLLTAWLIALAPAILGLFRGGAYNRADAAATAHYLVLFALTLVFWSAQNIYARAFYAAGDTLTPAISGTLVTLLSIPVYAAFFRGYGMTGLAIASDIGIIAHTLALMFLLRRKRFAPVAELDWPELARAFAAAVLAWATAAFVAPQLPHLVGHRGDFLVLGIGSAVWGIVAIATLMLTGSRLPSQVLARGKA